MAERRVEARVSFQSAAALAGPSSSTAPIGRFQRLGVVNQDWIARSGLVLVGLILVWHAWAHWGDVQVDAGRELYVPFAILRGDLLYRDLWYPYGPLAPYLEALLFRLFGVSLTVLYVFGICLAFGTALMAFTLSRHFLPVVPAFVVGFLPLVQGFEPGIFNYAFGYSYAAAIGSLLGLACLYCSVCHARNHSKHSNAMFLIGGLCGGLALLCKQEFGLACWLLLIFVLVIRTFHHRSVRLLAVDALSCAPGALIALLFYGWFFWQLSARFILLENLPINSYFMRTLGATWLARQGMRLSAREIVQAMAVDLMALGIWYLLSGALGSAVARGQAAGRRRLAVFLLAAGLGLGLAFAGHWSLSGVVSPDGTPKRLQFLITQLAFPMGAFWLALLMLAASLAGGLRGRRDKSAQARAILAVYAVAVGVRIMVRVVPAEYAIFYDVPLFLIFAIFVADLAGRSTRRLDETLHRRVLNGLFAAEAALLALLLWPDPQRLPARLTTSLGTVYTRPAEAALFPKIVAFMKRQEASGKRVLVLPEAPMLYVLSGSTAPTRWYEIVPGLLNPNQELEYVRELDKAKVSFILVTNRSTLEYGVPYFGLDYAQKIYDWINHHYEVVGEFGHFVREYRTDRWPASDFAVLIFERRSK